MPAVLGCVLWVTVSGAAWHTVHRWAEGLLSWDGLYWSLDRGNASAQLLGRLEIQLDLQFFILARLLGLDGRTVWLGLERGNDSAAWSALRRAVYSRPEREPAAEGSTIPPAHCDGA
ncbi:hypothetical protein M5C99_17915 [Acidovorax sp. NCPPB 2350]|nr:hypothetical protein M5C99_17915 [Acidovorax sp. NCPPB 2350]